MKRALFAVLLTAAGLIIPTAAHAATPADDSINRQCDGSHAIADITYHDGPTFTVWKKIALAPNGPASLDVTVKPECVGTTFGLASYEATSQVFEIGQIDQQRRFDYATAYAGDTTPLHLQVNVPDCYFQVDFFTGPGILHLKPTDTYSTPIPRLINWVNGGTHTCAPATTTTVKPTTTTSAPKATVPTTQAPKTAHYFNRAPAAVTYHPSTTTSTTAVPLPAQRLVLASTGISHTDREIQAGLILLGIGAALAISAPAIRTRRRRLAHVKSLEHFEPVE